MKNSPGHEEIEKLKTGIPGFDLISMGGLPKGRTTLAAGTAGSAKTVMAAQFLAEGINADGDSGVFVTFEEAPDDICDNMSSLGWDIGKWESQDKWAFVDASYQSEQSEVIAGNYAVTMILRV